MQFFNNCLRELWQSTATVCQLFFHASVLFNLDLHLVHSNLLNKKITEHSLNLKIFDLNNKVWGKQAKPKTRSGAQNNNSFIFNWSHEFDLLLSACESFEYTFISTCTGCMFSLCFSCTGVYETGVYENCLAAWPSNSLFASSSLTCIGQHHLVSTSSLFSDGPLWMKSTLSPKLHVLAVQHSHP